MSSSSALSQRRSLSNDASVADEVVDRRWSWSSVTDSDELVGRMSLVSRLPQYCSSTKGRVEEGKPARHGQLSLGRRARKWADPGRARVGVRSTVGDPQRGKHVRTLMQAMLTGAEVVAVKTILEEVGGGLGQRDGRGWGRSVGWGNDERATQASTAEISSKFRRRADNKHKKGAS